MCEARRHLSFRAAAASLVASPLFVFFFFVIVTMQSWRRRGSRCSRCRGKQRTHAESSRHTLGRHKCFFPPRCLHSLRMFPGLFYCSCCSNRSGGQTMHTTVLICPWLLTCVGKCLKPHNYIGSVALQSSLLALFFCVCAWRMEKCALHFLRIMSCELFFWSF